MYVELTAEFSCTSPSALPLTSVTSRLSLQTNHPSSTVRSLTANSHKAKRCLQLGDLVTSDRKSGQESNVFHVDLG